MLEREFDIVIIGAGIVGAMIGRFLSRYSLRILIIDKQADACMGASGGNAATIHAGHSACPGTLKAALNVRANPMWDNISEELGFPYKRCGDYVVATGPEEFPRLEKLLQQGKRNGVLGLEIISAEEIRKKEPEITPLVSGALWSRNGGYCDPWLATITTIEHAMQNGVVFLPGTMFDDFYVVSGQIVGIKTSRGDISCRWVINAAGIHADEIMHKLDLHPDFKITPRCGEFCILQTEEAQEHVLLAPLPNLLTKGISVKPMFGGYLLVGANANCTADKDLTQVTKDGMVEIWNGARKIIPGLDKSRILYTMVGLRATGNARTLDPEVDYQGDFFIESSSSVKGLINLAGIESPGLASSPAIALYVIELLKECGEKLVEKAEWNPVRSLDRISNQAILERVNHLKKLRFMPLPEPIANCL